MESNNILDEFLNQVKQNKKYKSIADEIIIEEIKNYLRENEIDKISRRDIKLVRSQLHKSYASFQTRKKSKIQDYLDELKDNPKDINTTNKLLSITLSTKERLNNYSHIYKKIFNITGKPDIIIDLGSGLNPFSYLFMNLSSLIYYSYDVDEQDIIYLNQYYKIMKSVGLNGKAQILNILDVEKIKNLPSSDIIFLFKVIDILDKNDHKTSEGLIKVLINKTKFLVASFATKTFTRKKMNYPNRKWFELMLNRNNLNFQIIFTDNEIFYIIHK